MLALGSLSAGIALAQGRPIPVAPAVESGPLAKKGYDHYTAQSDTASVRLRTRPGVVFAWSSVQVAHEPDVVTATGKRMHKPFVITKEIDSSSPKLALLAVSHEPIPELTLTLDGSSASGTSSDAAKSASSGAGAGKAVFQDLSIVSVKKVSATKEEVTMSYEKITWTWNGGSSSHDDWSK